MISSYPNYPHHIPIIIDGNISWINQFKRKEKYIIYIESINTKYKK